MKKQKTVSPRFIFNSFTLSLSFITSVLILTLFTTLAHSAQVTLSWHSVAEADGYKIYYGSESGTYQAPNDVGAQTTYSLSLDPGTYYFAVSAYNNYGESGYSEEVPCTISSDEPVVHIVVASAGSGGSISPTGDVSVGQDSDQSFAITPSVGFHVADVVVDGVSVGTVNSYTFSQVTQDHTIEAGFAIDTHVISASSGANGSITPAGQIAIEQGADQTFIFEPDENCHVSDVLIDGVSVGAVSSHTFSDVTQAHTVVANFAVNAHVITASAGENGTIMPIGIINIDQGANQTFTITADQGYHVADLLVDDKSVGAAATHTFSNVLADHTIEAHYEIDVIPTHVINASSGGNGSITPSGNVVVDHGTEQTFTIVPVEDYHVAELIVDGTSVGAQSSYTFSGITQAHTISAVFSIDTHNIIATAGDNGIIYPGGSVTVNHGASKTYLITPDTNYHITNVVVDGMSVGVVASYTFSNVTGNHAIFAGFGLDNHAPEANAGPDQSVEEGNVVTLSGANSSDSDPGDRIVSYLWEQTSGQTVNLSVPNSDVVTFTASDVGIDGEALDFRLTVTDMNGLESSDSCIVNISSINVCPVANAGLNQVANEGDSVTLDGSGSIDPDNDSISYLWEQTDGPQVVLSDSTAVQPTFTAPDIGTDGISITFQLTVEDYGGLKDTETCIVNVLWINVPPVADAGEDQTVVEGDTVTLDGSGSNDVENGIVSYLWIQTGGTPVTLSDPTVAQPTFTLPSAEQSGGSFVFQLTVKDGGGLEDADTCTISATSTASSPPVPEIKANGHDGPMSIASGDTLSITVSLDPGVDYAGKRVDWWISVLSPGDVWSSYKWRKYKWVDGIKRSVRKKIKSEFREVLNSDSLPPGKYVFYFSVDNNADSIPDSTWSDSVEVLIE